MGTDQQPEPDSEDDRHAHQQGAAQPALGGDACLDLFLLVLGALGQLLGQLDEGRLHFADLDRPHPRGVAGGDGRQLSSGRHLIPLKLCSDLLGEGDVVGVGMLGDELQGLAQNPGLVRDVGSGLGPPMRDIAMPCGVHVGQRHPGNGCG